MQEVKLATLTLKSDDERRCNKWEANACHVDCALEAFFAVVTHAKTWFMDRHSLNREFVLWCALDLRPFNIFAGTGFKRFMSRMEPQFS